MPQDIQQKKKKQRHTRLTDTQKQKLINDNLSGISQRNLAVKYGISPVTVNKIIKINNLNGVKRKTEELKQRELLLRKQLITIETEKVDTLDATTRQTLERQINSELRYWEKTSNSLIKTQDLADKASNQLIEYIANNPKKIQESIDKNDYIQLVGMLNKIASNTHTALHGKSNINVQTNVNTNDTEEAIIILPEKK